MYHYLILLRCLEVRGSNQPSFRALLKGVLRDNDAPPIPPTQDIRPYYGLFVDDGWVITFFIKPAIFHHRVVGALGWPQEAQWRPLVIVRRT